jgi:hypothetical protein
MGIAQSKLKGTVRGKVIELEQESGLPDGQQVAVALLPLFPLGEGIRRSAGAWADAGAELDLWLDETLRSRQQDRAELT